MIQLPNNIYADDSVTCTGLQGLSGNLQCNSTNNMFIRVFFPENINPNTTIQIEVKYIQNPYSEQPASPFVYYLFDSNGYQSLKSTDYQGISLFF